MHRKILLPICLIFALSAFLFFDVLRNNKALFDYVSDVDVNFTFQPIEHFFFESVKYGFGIPYYNVLSGFGSVFGADGQYGQYYLVKEILMRWSSDFNAYTFFYAFIHCALGGIFVYLIGRERKYSVLEGLTLSALYMTSSIFIIWRSFPHIYAFIAFYPLVYLSISQILNLKSGFAGILGLGLGLGLLINGGHLSSFYLVAIFMMFRIIVDYKKFYLKHKLVTQKLAISATVMALIAFPQILDFISNNSMPRSGTVPFFYSAIDFSINLATLHSSRMNDGSWFNGYLYYGPISILIVYSIFMKYKSNLDIKILCLFIFISTINPLSIILIKLFPYYSSLSNLNRFSYLFSLLIPLIIIDFIKYFKGEDPTPSKKLFIIIFLVIANIIIISSTYYYKYFWIISSFCVVFSGLLIFKNFDRKEHGLIISLSISLFAHLIIVDILRNFKYFGESSIFENSLKYWVIQLLFLAFIYSYFFSKSKKIKIYLTAITLLYSITVAIYLIQKNFNPKQQIDAHQDSIDLSKQIGYLKNQLSGRYVFICYPDRRILDSSTNLFPIAFPLADAYRSFHDRNYQEYFSRAYNFDFNRIVGGKNIIHSESYGRPNFEMLSDAGIQNFIVYKDCKYSDEFLSADYKKVGESSAFNIYHSNRVNFFKGENGLPVKFMNEKVQSIEYENHSINIFFKSPISLKNFSQLTIPIFNEGNLTAKTDIGLLPMSIGANSFGFFENNHDEGFTKSVKFEYNSEPKRRYVLFTFYSSVIFLMAYIFFSLKENKNA